MFWVCLSVCVMQFIWTITVADKALKCPRFTAKVQPLHMWCNVFRLHIERRGNVSKWWQMKVRKQIQWPRPVIQFSINCSCWLTLFRTFKAVCVKALKNNTGPTCSSFTARWVCAAKTAKCHHHARVHAAGKTPNHEWGIKRVAAFVQLSTSFTLVWNRGKKMRWRKKWRR